MGTVYSVATPIGNLEDISLRALRILREVAVIVCEDTRTTTTLLKTYSITTPTISLHQHSTKQQFERVLQRVQHGESIAMVTDAGTPAISDPGSQLIHLALAAGIAVVPIPGPSALITAVQAAGVDCSSFLYLGFLPHKKGRQTLLQVILNEQRTVVFYESPHRLLKTLAALCTGKRQVVVARELTKLYEKFVRGTAQQVYTIFAQRPKILGEYVIIVHS